MILIAMRLYQYVAYTTLAVALLMHGVNFKNVHILALSCPSHFYFAHSGMLALKMEPNSFVWLLTLHCFQSWGFLLFSLIKPLSHILLDLGSFGNGSLYTYVCPCFERRTTFLFPRVLWLFQRCIALPTFHFQRWVFPFEPWDVLDGFSLSLKLFLNLSVGWLRLECLFISAWRLDCLGLSVGLFNLCFGLIRLECWIVLFWVFR